MQRARKVAPQLDCDRGHGAEGDAGSAEPMIECLRLEAARRRLIGEHDVEPVRLQLIDQRPDLRLPADDVDRIGEAKRRLENLEGDQL